MHVRGRVVRARLALAPIAAILLLSVAGVGPAVAGGSGALTATTRPIAREQQPGDPTGYRLPFAPGLEVEIVQAWHSTYSHNGRAEYAYDFGLFDGTAVLAAASGIVTFTHDGEIACGGPKLMDDVNYVTIDHPDGSSTFYAHLSNVEVKVGDVVVAGQEIGKSGRSGYTECRPHLHFARQVQGGAVTQSIPVFFDGFAKAPLQLGEVVAAPTRPCETAQAQGAASADADAEADAGKGRGAATVPLGAFCGVYMPLAAGSPAQFERVERAVDFDWNEAAPGGYWLDDPVDGFSASWSGRFPFLPGTYAFRAVATGPVRVTIDGRTVLNLTAFDLEPDLGARRAFTARVHVGQGIHQIDVLAASPSWAGILSLDWSARVLDGAAGRWARSLEPG